MKGISLSLREGGGPSREVIHSAHPVPCHPAQVEGVQAPAAEDAGQTARRLPLGSDPGDDEPAHGAAHEPRDAVRGHAPRETQAREPLEHAPLCAGADIVGHLQPRTGGGEHRPH